MAHITIKSRKYKHNLSPYMPSCELFPAKYYSPDLQSFVMADESVGFSVVCEPITSLDECARQEIEGLFQDTPFPADTFLQVSMFRSPDLRAELAAINNLKGERDDPIAEAYFKDRTEQLERASLSPEARTGAHEVLFDLKILVTIKLPMAGEVLSPAEKAALLSLQKEVVGRLEQSGMQPRLLDANGYLRVMQTLLNWGERAGWRTTDPECDTKSDLSDQILEANRAIEIDGDALQVGDCHVRTLSAASTPVGATFGQAMAAYVGDVMYGIDTIPEHYLVTMNVHYPSTSQRGFTYARQTGLAASKWEGKAKQCLRGLSRSRKLADVIALRKAARAGGPRVVKLALTATVFAPSASRADAASATLQKHWTAEQFSVKSNRGSHHVHFLQSLPFGCSPTALEESWRFQTATTRDAAALAPVFGEWKGTGTPHVSLVSRNGQLMSYSKFDNTINHHAMLAGRTGAGKSFAARSEIEAYLAAGAMVVLIDEARGNTALVEKFGGLLLAVSPESTLCLNPFTDIEDITREIYPLCETVALMVSPNAPLNETQQAQLVEVLNSVYQQHGNAAGTDALYDAMVSHAGIGAESPMTQALQAFTSRGPYGQFFNGPNTMGFHAGCTAICLEGLRQQKHLEQVVLSTLLHQTWQAMSHDAKTSQRPRLLYIDGTDQLLATSNLNGSLDNAFRGCRQLGASLNLIGQQLGVPADGGVPRSMKNCRHYQLFGENEDMIEHGLRNGHYFMEEAQRQLWASLAPHPSRRYDMLLIREASRGATEFGIGRVLVTDEQALLYSDRLDDWAALNAYHKEGVTGYEAVKAVLRDRQEGAAAGGPGYAKAS